MIVTRTLSSFCASCAGGGRKSSITRNSMGSSVYFIFFFIGRFSFPPISGANDPDGMSPICESDGYNLPFDSPETKITLFFVAMSQIPGNDTPRVPKRAPGTGEWMDQRLKNVGRGCNLFKPVSTSFNIFQPRIRVTSRVPVLNEFDT